MSNETIGILGGLGSALGWAVGAILFKRIAERMSPLLMAFGKSGLSAVLLAVGLACWGGRIPQGEDALLLVLSGLVGIALADVLFFAALRELSPQVLIIFLTVGQVITAVLAILFLGEVPHVGTWVGMALILAGVSAVLWPKESGLSWMATRKGILYGLLSSLCMSGSMIMAKGALDETSALEATFLRMAAAFFGLLLWLVVRRQLTGAFQIFGEKGLARQFTAAVCVITFGGFWLSLVAVKNLPVAPATSLISLEPVFILPLAAIFLREKIYLRDVAGACLACIGAAVLCYSFAQV